MDATIAANDFLCQISYMPYCLFNAQPRNLQNLKFQDTSNGDELEKETWMMDTNFNIAISLMRYQQKIDTKLSDDLESSLCKVLDANESDAIAWINKAMYETIKCPPDLAAASAAIVRANDLLQEDQVIGEAKIQYAFWLCTMMNDDIGEWQRGLKLFGEALDGVHSLIRHHYLYMKSLVKQTHIQTSAQLYFPRLFEQLIKLHNCDNVRYKFQMFLCLARSQQNRNVAQAIKAKADILKNEFGQAPDTKFCVEQIGKLLQENPDMILFANSYASVALCLMETAAPNRLSDVTKCLGKALEYAKRYVHGQPSRNIKGPYVCAQIILYQWAVRYYAKNKLFVDDVRRSRGYTEEPMQKKVWLFLRKEYHALKADDDPKTRTLLTQALSCLETHYELGGPFVPEYPRVLGLLGEDFDTVSAAYARGPQGIPYDKYIALTHKGLFYESNKRTDEAKMFLNQAITDTDYQNTWFAERALTRLNQRD